MERLHLYWSVKQVISIQSLLIKVTIKSVFTKLHRFISSRGGKIIIHPKANAVVSASDEAALRQRNLHIKSINQDGVLAWRRTSGYYRQSEVENMFFRYKKLIGDELRARNEDSRRVESVITCNILNQFRLLGNPQSELIVWRPNQKTGVV